MLNIPKIPKLLLFVLIALFIFFLFLYISIFLGYDENEFLQKLFYTGYGVVALLGSMLGFYAAKSMGGFSSALGKTVLFLSAGLLFQEIGQIIFSYYNLVPNVEVPYPSFADIGYFGSIPLYIAATYFLSKVLGGKLSVYNSLKNKLIGILLPLSALLIVYFTFIKGYDFSGRSILVVLLDYGYPIGQVVYVTAAVTLLNKAKGVIGGLMKPRIVLLTLAFVMQYISEFNFLYQSYHETWKSGEYGDLLYFISYLIMSISILYIYSMLYVDSKTSNTEVN
jgi:hypothetical protein